MHPYLVHQFLEAQAQRRPEAVFVVERSERTTYGEVETRANRIARLLLAEGIQKGDRVGLVAANSRHYVEAYFGILKSGAVAVPSNAAADPRTHAEILRLSGARGVILGPRMGALARGLTGLAQIEFAIGHAAEGGQAGLDAAEAPRVGPRWIDVSLADATSGEPPGVALIDLDRAAIIYTSGSTGTPRGAVLRHANIVANTRSIVEYLALEPADRILVVLPFHYVYGKSLLHTHAAAGGALVIENRFLFPQEALDTLEREEATGFAGVPSSFAILLNKSNLASRRLPSLRYVTQAGGPMPPETQRRLIEALPGKRIFIMYGATEASARLSFLPPEDLARKLGSIGKAIPNVELRILRDDGTEADTNEIGEIVARGSNLMEGYWEDPEETRAVLDAAGYHTGDLGRRDEEGFLYVVGRKREMIKSGAHRISPKEIEEALAACPSVHEAAVVGSPDEILGESIVAFVSIRPGQIVETRALAEWCRARLAPHKVPHSIRILAEMPHNAAGKPDKPRLREAAARPAGEAG
jgi:acyl-CoA synthetase (AMP-forming)/AMP-acid ligase II